MIPFTLLCVFLLAYVFIKPYLNHIVEVKNSLPHGEAQELQLQESVAYKHIGITTDFSKNDQKVIQEALKQGNKEAQYTFIHVVETAAARYHGHFVLDQETKLDEENLQKYTSQLEKLGYKADYKIGFGNTVKAIVDFVDDNEIDFLVMGAHGHKGIKDIIFGSTVVKVRHQIKVPLLIIQ